MQKKVKPGSYEIVREGSEDVMQVNYEAIPYAPSIEDYPEVMMDVLDKLIENPGV